MNLSKKLTAVILSTTLLLPSVPFSGSVAQAASDKDTLASWLQTRAGVVYDQNTEANKSANTIMNAAIADFPYTTTRDYNIAQAFRNVQGWSDNLFHYTVKNKETILATDASISRWTGVFLNDFSGITSKSGKAIVTDLLNFNIDKSYLTGGVEANTGYTMMPESALNQAKLIGALNPANDEKFQESGQFTQQDFDISAYRTGLMNQKFKTMDLWAPNGKAPEGMKGLYEITKKGGSLPKYFLYMNEFVQSIGGTMVEVQNFNGLPGFTTDKNAYRGYTTYQMTPFPVIKNVKPYLNTNNKYGKTGFEFSYKVYG